jgi:Secretion system C-terminal sorting domain
MGAFVDRFRTFQYQLPSENSKSGLSVSQGYQDFNFSIPTGSIITGIRVDVLAHGNAGFTLFYLNALKVDVFYTISTGAGSTLAAPHEIEIYPNPAHSNFTLSVTGLTRLKYSLFSIEGKMILDKNEGSISNNFTSEINIAGISPGVYILRVESNLGSEYRKVAIQ